MKKILLIEDDPKLSLALQMRLKMMNFDVASSADAIRAMDEANKHQPELVILDINLPGGNGFVVADRLRKNPKTMTTPIIFITASEKPEYLQKAKSISHSAYLQKPFDAAQLAEALDACLYNDDTYEL